MHTHFSSLYKKNEKNNNERNLKKKRQTHFYRSDFLDGKWRINNSAQNDYDATCPNVDRHRFCIYDWIKNVFV